MEKHLYLLIHNYAILINLNKLLKIHSKVCSFTSSIVLDHLRAYVTVFIRKTYQQVQTKLLEQFYFWPFGDFKLDNRFNKLSIQIQLSNRGLNCDDHSGFDHFKLLCQCIKW